MEETKMDRLVIIPTYNEKENIEQSSRCDESADRIQRVSDRRWFA